MKNIIFICLLTFMQVYAQNGPLIEPVANPDFKIVKSNGKYGLFNNTEQFYIQPAVYDTIYLSCDGNCDFPKYILLKGDTLKLLAYDGLPLTTLIGKDSWDAYFEIKILQLSNGGYQLVKNFKPIIPDTFECIEVVRNLKNRKIFYFKTRKNGKYGLLNAKIQVLLKNELDTIIDENEYLLAVKNTEYTLYNYDLDLLENIDSLPESYENYCHTHVLLLRKNNLYGLYDLYLKKFVVEPQSPLYYWWHADPDYPLSDIRVAFIKDETINIYSGSGMLLNNLEGSYVGGTRFADTWLMNQHNQWIFTDTTGKQTSKNFDDIAYSGNDANFYVIKKNGKWGCVDFKGREILKAQYNNYCTENISFPSTVLLMQNESEIHFISEDGKILKKEKLNGKSVCN